MNASELVMLMNEFRRCVELPLVVVAGGTVDAVTFCCWLLHPSVEQMQIATSPEFVQESIVTLGWSDAKPQERVMDVPEIPAVNVEVQTL